ncbi:MAG: MFS transporter [Alphaproteobacteria bacterium]
MARLAIMKEKLRGLEWALAIASLATYLAGGMAGEVSPLLMGAVLDDLSLSTAQGGFVFSVEMAVMAVVTLASGPFMGVIQRQRAARWATVLIIAGAVGASLSSGLVTFMGARVVSAIGAGLVFSIGTCILGAAREPDRVSAMTATMQPVITMSALLVLPLLIVPYGRMGAYGALAILAGLSIYAYRYIPRAPREGAPLKTALQGIARNRTSAHLSEDAPPLWLPVALIGSWFFLTIGEFGAYIFSERRGQDIGMSPEAIGLALTLMAASGLVGAFIATALGRRLGRVTPFIAGLSIAIAGVFLTFDATSATGFTLGLMLWGGGFFLMFPFYVGALAMLDIEGRWVALATGVAMVAVAFSPSIIGLIIDGLGFEGVRIISTSLMGVTLVLTSLSIWAAGRFEQQRGPRDAG